MIPLMERQAAFLVALAEAGIPPDIQELLVQGNPERGIAPGALSKAIDAAEAAAPTLLGQVCRDRDEADRRAGSAERELARANESIVARNGWLLKAKEEAGYHPNVSFDVVWKDALTALLELRAQPPAVDDMPVMDHGMRTTPGYAAEQLRRSGMVGLTHNLERLQEWLDMYVARARAIGEGQPPSHASQALDAFAWLKENTDLELAYHVPQSVEQGEAWEWRVRSSMRPRGGDEIVGRGRTPIEAILASREAIRAGR